MALLIDGYNLLHVTDIFGAAATPSETALHASRQALLDFLAAALDTKTRGQTTIVFDAAGAPPGLPATLQHQGLTVHFARRYADADEMLEQIIEDCAEPRSLTVVSGDHRVQRAARRRAATYVDSDQWFRDLRSARRAAADSQQAGAKPSDTLTPEQVAYWLEEFSERPPRSE